MNAKNADLENHHWWRSVWGIYSHLFQNIPIHAFNSKYIMFINSKNIFSPPPYLLYRESGNQSVGQSDGHFPGFRHRVPETETQSPLYGPSISRPWHGGSRKIPPTKNPPTKIPPTKIPPSENSTHVKFHPTIDWRVVYT